MFVITPRFKVSLKCTTCYSKNVIMVIREEPPDKPDNILAHYKKCQVRRTQFVTKVDAVSF